MVSNTDSAQIVQIEEGAWEQGVNLLDYISASVNIKLAHRVWNITHKIRIKDRYVTLLSPIQDWEIEKELRKIK